MYLLNNYSGHQIVCLTSPSFVVLNIETTGSERSRILPRLQGLRTVFQEQWRCLSLLHSTMALFLRAAGEQLEVCHAVNCEAYCLAAVGVAEPEGAFIAAGFAAELFACGVLDRVDCCEVFM